MQKITCPNCGGQNIKKAGFLASGKQRYVCKDCKKGFSSGNNLVKKPKVDDVCPYCGGELTTKGWNTSGTRRYKCKVCGKGCSEKTVKTPKESNVECPYCHSKFTKKGGKLRDGSLRYVCNTCKKGFSEKTIIKDLSGIKCTHCGSTNIGTSGLDTKTGKQRYLCHDCRRRFVENPTQFTFVEQKVTCPHCGHNYAKKAGKTSGKQYYICLACGHKYLENGCFKHLTENQKRFIINLVLKGKNKKEVAELVNCSEKTVRNIFNDYCKTETLTTAQRELIIKYGVQFAVPAEYIAPYVPCSLQKCKEILSHYVIKEPKRKELTEQERLRENIILDRFLA